MVGWAKSLVQRVEDLERRVRAGESAYETVRGCRYGDLPSPSDTDHSLYGRSFWHGEQIAVLDGEVKSQRAQLRDLNDKLTALTAHLGLKFSTLPPRPEKLVVVPADHDTVIEVTEYQEDDDGEFQHKD